MNEKKLGRLVKEAVDESQIENFAMSIMKSAQDLIDYVGMGKWVDVADCLSNIEGDYKSLNALIDDIPEYAEALEQDLKDFLD